MLRNNSYSYIQWKLIIINKKFHNTDDLQRSGRKKNCMAITKAISLGPVDVCLAHSTAKTLRLKPLTISTQFSSRVSLDASGLCKAH